MAKDVKKERLERFKTALLKWKEAHESEYDTFARAMRSGDASCYMRFYRSIILMMPKFRRKWKRDWDSDSLDNFDDITVLIKESDLPGEIVDLCLSNNDGTLPDSGQSDSIMDMFRKLFGMKPKPKVRLSLPLVMCWLYFGKSFESMVEMLNGQLRSKEADAMDREKCSMAVKAVIKASLSGGYRTQQDWDRYFERQQAIYSGNAGRWAMDEIRKENALENAVAQQEIVVSGTVTDEPKSTGRKKSETRPLSDYLNCGNTGAVIEVIRRFIIDNNTGNGLALPYFALTQLGLFSRMVDNKEYSTGLLKQFEGIQNLKSESSCRQAIGNLRKQQYITVNGKMTQGILLESDEFGPLLKSLKDKIFEAIKGENEPN